MIFALNIYTIDTIFHAYQILLNNSSDHSHNALIQKQENIASIKSLYVTGRKLSNGQKEKWK